MKQLTARDYTGRADVRDYPVTSCVEYGSFFQGTADAQSDHDLLYVVRPPAEDVIFMSGKRHVVHEENRYYTEDEFIRRIFNVSLFSLILLLAQLTQDNSRYTRDVLAPFRNEHLLRAFILHNAANLGLSMTGDMAKGGTDGKAFVRTISRQRQLDGLIRYLEGGDIIEIVRVDVSDVIHMKRLPEGHPDVLMTPDDLSAARRLMDDKVSLMLRMHRQAIETARPDVLTLRREVERAYTRYMR